MLAQPLGQGTSLILAAGTIALRRPVASRWVFARTEARCLWCGGAPATAEAVELGALPRFQCCGHERVRWTLVVFAVVGSAWIVASVWELAGRG